MKKIDLNNIFSDNPKIKFSCAKDALLISEENPSQLYDNIDFFIKLLSIENKIIKWSAIKIIGNLSKVDSKNRIDNILPTFYSFLHDKTMITASNTIYALGVIALNIPQFQDEILTHFLEVESIDYCAKGKISPECRNVAIGQVIKSLSKFDKSVLIRKDVKSFLKRQTQNTRNSVRKSAEKLLSC